MIKLRMPHVDPPEWQYRMLRRGEVVPIVSDFVSRDLLFNGVDKLASAWAGDVDYPWESISDLLEVARFIDQGGDALYAKSDYLDFVKAYLLHLAEQTGVASHGLIEDLKHRYEYSSLASLAEELGYLSASTSVSSTLNLLATIPCPVYLTTSYHGLLEDALVRQGRSPHTDFSRWHEQLRQIPLIDAPYKPSSTEPLVFHLFGTENYPASIVLTERDHMAWFTAVNSRNNEGVLEVFSERSRLPWLWLGYRLEDLDFMVLDHVVKMNIGIGRRSSDVFVNALPSTEREKRYWEGYLHEEQVDLHWSTPEEYLRKFLRVGEES